MFSLEIVFSLSAIVFFSCRRSTFCVGFDRVSLSAIVFSLSRRSLSADLVFLCLGDRVSHSRRSCFSVWAIVVLWLDDLSLAVSDRLCRRLSSLCLGDLSLAISIYGDPFPWRALLSSRRTFPSADVNANLLHSSQFGGVISV